MADEIAGFKLEDLRRLYSLLSRVANVRVNDRARPAVVEDSVYDASPMAPEVYVVKAGPDGVPASIVYSEALGTGTGAQSTLIPGAGTSQVLFLAEDPTFATEGKFRNIDGYDNLRIYNLSDRDIQAGAWLLATRVKGGQFIVIAEVETSDVDTGTSTIAAGCHLYYDALGNLSLNVPSLVGQYLSAGTGTCPLLNVFIPLSCGLDYATDGSLFLNLEEVVGTGLNWEGDDGDGCRLTVKFACHIFADEEGRLNVNAESLAGDRGVTGLRKGPIVTQVVSGPGGPGLETEVECDTIGNDYEVDHSDQQIVLTDSRLIKIGNNLTQVNLYALNAYHFNLAGELVDWQQLSTSLVIKNIDICSFVCDTGTGTGTFHCTGTGTPCCYWYCVSNPSLSINYVCAQICSEDDLLALADAGFVINSGPHDAQIDCTSVCCEVIPGWGGEGWYCVYERPSLAQWYCVTSTFLGYATCEFLTPEELAEVSGVINSGPHATYAACAAACFTGTGLAPGTGESNCFPTFLTEADKCDPDIEICSGPFPNEAIAAAACACARTGTGTDDKCWYCITTVFLGVPSCEHLTQDELQAAIDVGGVLHSGPHATPEACAAVCADTSICCSFALSGVPNLKLIITGGPAAGTVTPFVYVGSVGVPGYGAKNAWFKNQAGFGDLYIWCEPGTAAPNQWFFWSATAPGVQSVGVPTPPQCSPFLFYFNPFSFGATSVQVSLA